MISTGNDIVSLNAINTERTKQPGFYSKILSTSEQTLYNESEFSAIPFENFVWLLWSIKESAFKYLQRINPDLIFSPTKFIVEKLVIPFEYSVLDFEATEVEGVGFDNVLVIKGAINCRSETLYSRTIIYKEGIVTLVNANESFENTSWGVKMINKPDTINQGKEVRAFLANRLNSDFDTGNMMIAKSLHGFPIVMEGSKEIPIPVSLSHHHDMVAYSFQTEDFQNK